MEVKIKNADGSYSAAELTIENNTMIVSPKVEKFEPKDGDIVTYTNGDKATIYVFAGGYKYNTSFYVAYSGLRNEVFKTPKGHLDMNRDDIRPATEEEKQKLFDKLAEEGWEWDSEKKELRKKIWKPKDHEKVYVAGFTFYNENSFCPFEDTAYSGSAQWRAVEKRAWYFKTEEECQEFCNRLNEAINQVKP